MTDRRSYKTRDKRRGTGSCELPELKRLVTYVTPEAFAQLAASAREQEISNSALAARAIEFYIDNGLTG